VNQTKQNGRTGRKEGMDRRNCEAPIRYSFKSLTIATDVAV